MRGLRRPVRPAILRAQIAVLLLALSGCASMVPSLEAPTVELTAVEVAEMSFASQTVVLGFKVFNPNALALPVKGIRYRVRLNDQEFAGGETAGRFSIPAEGEGSFAISVELDLMRSGPQLAMMLQSGVGEDLRYELDGDLEIDVPTSPTLRFREKGVIPLHIAGR